jgi:hypothetical protein
MFFARFRDPSKSCVWRGVLEVVPSSSLSKLDVSLYKDVFILPEVLLLRLILILAHQMGVDIFHFL